MRGIETMVVTLQKNIDSAKQPLQNHATTCEFGRLCKFLVGYILIFEQNNINNRINMSEECSFTYLLWMLKSGKTCSHQINRLIPTRYYSGICHDEQQRWPCLQMQ